MTQAEEQQEYAPEEIKAASEAEAAEYARARESYLLNRNVVLKIEVDRRERRIAELEEELRKKAKK